MKKEGKQKMMIVRELFCSKLFNELFWSKFKVVFGYSCVKSCQEGQNLNLFSCVGKEVICSVVNCCDEL